MGYKLYYILVKCKYEASISNIPNLKIDCYNNCITSELQISNFLSIKISLDFFYESSENQTKSTIFTERLLK